MDHLEKLKEEISNIDIESIPKELENVQISDDADSRINVLINNRDVKVKVTEKQRVYVWIRIYSKEEVDIVEDDNLEIEYLPSGEKIDAKFVSFGKKNLNRDHDGQIINFDPEIEKKTLCLMVDEDEINNRKDIPFIRTLFKTSRFYEHQIIRRSDLTFTNKRTKESIEYIDCDF